MKTRLSPDWPVLTTYDADHLAHVAMPIGGIGTGCVSLGGRGDLRDWEIMNRPAKGFTPHGNFFALNVQSGDGRSVTRTLEGPIEAEYYESARGCRQPNHGLPRFKHASFACAYPLGQVTLTDPEVPVDVRIEAFNPLVPADADASGLPVAVVRFVLTNPTARTVKASICGNLTNFIGSDGSTGQRGWAGQVNNLANCKRNTNRVQKADGLTGIAMSSRGVDRSSEAFGTMALATTATRGVTCSAGREHIRYFWEHFNRTGRVKALPPSGDAPIGAVSVSMTLRPRTSQIVTFLIAWRFPNRYGWTWDQKPAETVGNYYAKRYRSAWAAAATAARDLPSLEKRTVAFVQSLCDSDLPDVVKEAALYNTSTFSTQTCFRTTDGRLFGWEGCNEDHGCCLGSCTHVWNYEQATGYLFGDLSWTMRDVELTFSTREDGFMHFRTLLPLDRKEKDKWGIAAADGQMGALMRLYRDWRLSGNDTALKKLWPKARKALEFCWLAKGWDANKDGVMEGAQHHTLDSEYFGPNPLTGVWYLGALRACEEIARHLGETDFADTCRKVFDRGSRWLDKHLFNGEYYEHKIKAPGKISNVLDGLIWHKQRKDLATPESQLGKGCLCDQLVGQYMAHACGLGYLLKPANIRKTYRSLMRYNFREHFRNNLNISRSFMLNDDKGLLMCSYPRGRRPKVHSGCYTECMTGFEYAAAIGMLQEGQTAAGLKCIRAIRDRYDGKTRSPFDEAECGHHYARAMASWGAIVTLTGFQYSAVDKTLAFASAEKSATWFWSNGYAWGTVTQKRTRRGVEVKLTVIEGELELSSLTITGIGTAVFRTPRKLTTGRTLRRVV